MANQLQSRATPTKTEQRLDELRALSAELEAEGRKLTAAIIGEKFAVSPRQARRYLNALAGQFDNEKRAVKLAQSMLDAVPLMTKVLREDLQAIEAITGESEEERLALVKMRRDQVMALARVSSQFLKELRDLGLAPKVLNAEQSGSGHLEDAGPLSPEAQAEIERLADEELDAFERELA